MTARVPCAGMIRCKYAWRRAKASSEKLAATRDSLNFDGF